MKQLNIIFAGTPEFTLPCLNALHNSEHNLIAVYTQPDRPAGRGRNLQVSAVKEWALQHKLPVYQPLNFKDPTTIQTLKNLQPDLIIVIAYGLILPKTVLEIPKFGCINVHASLLPLLRGAAPIQQAILQGEQETGVTIMQMDVGMDTGDILLKKSCRIEANDTSSSLHQRLSELAAPALLETLSDLVNNQLKPQQQDNSKATYATKIYKNDAKINWHNSAQLIDQAIRGYNPWPIAYTQLNDLIIRIYQAKIIQQTSNTLPGTILKLDKHGILINTGTNILCVEKIQYPGGKIITIADCINAKNCPFQIGMTLQ